MLMSNKIRNYKNIFKFNFGITTEEKYKVQLEYITKDLSWAGKDFMRNDVSLDTWMISKTEPGKGASGEEEEEVPLRELWL